MNGWTVADVARRHDLTRQHIYQWRREMRRKELWPENDAPSFLPVEIAVPSTEALTEPGDAAAEITVDRKGTAVRDLLHRLGDSLERCQGFCGLKTKRFK